MTSTKLSTMFPVISKLLTFLVIQLFTSLIVIFNCFPLQSMVMAFNCFTLNNVFTSFFDRFESHNRHHDHDLNPSSNHHQFRSSSSSSSSSIYQLSDKIISSLSVDDALDSLLVSSSVNSFINMDWMIQQHQQVGYSIGTTCNLVNSNWESQLTAKCPINQWSNINLTSTSSSSSTNFQQSTRSNHDDEIIENLRQTLNGKFFNTKSTLINLKIVQDILHSLAGRLKSVPLAVNSDAQFTLIYNSSELRLSIMSPLVKLINYYYHHLKKHRHVFLPYIRLRDVKDHASNDQQTTEMINLIKDRLKIDHFKAILLFTTTMTEASDSTSSNSNRPTQQSETIKTPPASPDLHSNRISLDYTNDNGDNQLVANDIVLIGLLFTNETSKITLCFNSTTTQFAFDNQTFIQLFQLFFTIILIITSTLALLKFILKRIGSFKRKFKYWSKVETIYLDERCIIVANNNDPGDLNHFIGTFKEEKVYLKRLPNRYLPARETTRNLFGQMIKLRNYNLADFKGLVNYNNVHSHHNQSLISPIGCFLVWEYCARGSLQDIIKSKCIDFDWSFKLSLLYDLSNGLKYLHSTIGKHGWLNSANCVVDSKWLLKITNFGLMTLNQFQHQQQQGQQRHHHSTHNNNDQPDDWFESLSFKDLLWCSPEIVKCFINPKNDDDDIQGQGDNLTWKRLRRSGNSCCWGSKESDIYSLAIIMSELINQSSPYNSNHDDDDDDVKSIICSIASGIYVRPMVDSTEVPDDIICLMEQCWSDYPDHRPSIGDIHEKFLVHSQGKTIIDSMIRKLEKYTINLEAIVTSRTLKLEEEMKKTDSLLYRMLPVPVADALKMGQTIEPDKFEAVTVYFSDIVGFTTISAYSKPIEIISLLNDLYTTFDRIIDSYQVYKVETIGDAYMVVSGVPERRSDHAEQIADMALDILHNCTLIKIAHLPGVPLKIRIGINTGPVVAGVVGTAMPRYCLFGNTVNIASRMESTGRAYRIQISKRTERILRASGIYHIEYRGEVDLKGRGKKSTYWLTGKENFNKKLPEPEDDDGDNHGFRDCEIIEIFGSNSKTSSDVSPSSPTGSMSPISYFEPTNSATRLNHASQNVLQVPKQ